ncbi:pyridoxamine 5'-phosphate oxidase family protein [Streptomyces sp. V3I7]|uniref:pyridoxamine 5'-phosphate oxidase family protein n=1 Tax=Streptomyces sp. V3I7 TaxID=3042278 RepID=UPI00277E5B7D|nr:pyridoxamine 5'-phosphate oxidase family protein [Streptomyces sp. V3I7]MDQ0989047.1 general stress protein 26 [Streptomyces sp. V3I7]
MKITEQPRGPERRRQDVLARLERERDVWVATADAGGLPCLVALWFVWDGEHVWLSTRLTNPTGRNLRDGARARLAFGDTHDVVLIDGDVETFTVQDVPEDAAEAFRARTGWNPGRDSPSYAYFRIRPRAVQTWRGEHELRGRHVMRDGAWTT